MLPLGFPPGEAKCASRQREAKSLPYNGRCKIMSLYHSTQHTPSVIPSGCQLPQRGSQGGCAASGRLRASPTGCGGNHWLAVTHGGHALSQPVRADSSLREGAKGASRQREAKSLPYRVRRKSLACSNQRGTLPQLRVRSAAPSEREPRALRAVGVSKPVFEYVVTGRVREPTYSYYPRSGTVRQYHCLSGCAA